MANELKGSKRIWFVVAGMVAITVLILWRLVSFQLVEPWLYRNAIQRGGYVADGDESVPAYLLQGQYLREQSRTVQPPRGFIRDRDGDVLAAPGNQFDVGVNPPFIVDTDELAKDLAPILVRPAAELQALFELDQQYVMLERRVSAEKAAELKELDHPAVQLDPQPLRIYPQGELLCHALGYVDYENTGNSGIEAHYNSLLAGVASSERRNASPTVPRQYQTAQGGADLYLTIDATVQRVVEDHLREAIAEYEAEGGQMIAMDPQTGAILAMATTPCFDPELFYDTPPEQFLNPTISKQYEPGSVFKLITMSAALDSGAAAPSSVYNDTGVFSVGGFAIRNSDLAAHGTTNMTDMLRKSLNVGTATIASWMPDEAFYSYLARFGFGSATDVDVTGEATGTILRPGDPLWSPIDKATASFGQGIAITPIQLVSAISAIANEGQQLRPHLVSEIRYPDGSVDTVEPEIISQPISAQTAAQVTNMAVEAARPAQFDGYTVAGKTGTAQIPEGGVYHPTDTIHSFVGWLPADDPQLLLLVRLDRVKAVTWGSESAAPTFAKLAEELVVLLNIPPDDVRLGTQPLQAGN